MKYDEKIRKELANDKFFKAIYDSIKPEERKEVDGAVDELIKLASYALSSFQMKASESDITMEQIESAIKDRTGRK